MLIHVIATTVDVNEKRYVTRFIENLRNEEQPAPLKIVVLHTVFGKWRYINWGFLKGVFSILRLPVIS